MWAIKNRLVRGVFVFGAMVISSSAFAQSGSSTMDASKMFGKNTTKDGPITVCSDMLSYSQKNHQLIYQGDVVVLQVKGANILCTSTPIPENNTNDIASTYSFAKINTLGDYEQKQAASLKEAKEICKKQNGCRFLAGQKLTILFTADNKAIDKVILTTDDEHTAKFYSIPFPKPTVKDANDNAGKDSTTKDDDPPMYARGQIMTLEMQKNLLTIEKNAYINRGGNQFSGKKVLYNTNTGVVTVPDTGTRATVILNNSDINK